jgi:hypothetical protein
VKLSKLLRGAPPAREASPPRRLRRIRREDAPGTIIPGAPQSRRTVRPDGPKTIIPIVDEAATPLVRDLDAARERLRRAIPPVDDDLE